MNTQSDRPPFPADLATLCEPAIFASLSTLEVGAVYRIVSYAWGQPEACEVPGDTLSLEAVSGCSSEEWARIGKRVLLALGAMQAPTSGYSHRLRIPRSVFEELSTRQSRQRAQRTQAAKARWYKDAHPPPDDPGGVRPGCGPDAGRMRAACESDANRIPALSLRSASSEFPESEALSLQRPNSKKEIQSAQGAEFSQQSAPEEDVIALLGEGARAQQQQMRRRWLKEQSLTLLHAAWARWARAGYVTAPIAKAQEICEAEAATPARVEFLIGEADGMIARYEASNRSGRSPNPVGLLIARLGLSRTKPEAPCDVPLILTQKWARLEDTRARLEHTNAALMARRQQIARAGTAIPQRESAG